MLNTRPHDHEVGGQRGPAVRSRCGLVTEQTAHPPGSVIHPKAVAGHEAFIFQGPGSSHQLKNKATPAFTVNPRGGRWLPAGQPATLPSACCGDLLVLLNPHGDSSAR